jgi:hypothetical protein
MAHSQVAIAIRQRMGGVMPEDEIEASIGYSACGAGGATIGCQAVGGKETQGSCPLCDQPKAWPHEHSVSRPQ